MRVGEHQNGAEATIDLDRLLQTRLLIQASSGGGKSNAMRVLMERAGATHQVIVIDPEGEFPTLREALPDLLIVGTGGEMTPKVATAGVLARRLLELGASAVLDLYDLQMADRRAFVRGLVSSLMSAPRSAWRPLLVGIDEAHAFCAEAERDMQSAGPIIDLMSQGRKRQFCGILATQRLSKLHKDAAAEASNVMIGVTTLDIDQKRAADVLGFDRAARQALRGLKPGQFHCFGPAFGAEGVTLVQVDRAQTRPEQIGHARIRPSPPASTEVQRLVRELADLAHRAETDVTDIDDAKAKIAALEKKLKAAEGAAHLRAPDPVAERLAREEGESAARRDAAGAVARLVGEARPSIERLSADAQSVARMIGSIETMFAHAPTAKTAKAEQSDKWEKAERHPVPLGRNTAPAASKGANGLDGPQQRIVDALAWYTAMGKPVVERPAVAAKAGYRPGGGHFNNVLGACRTAGLIEYPREGCVALTEIGNRRATWPTNTPTIADVHDAWLGICDGPQRRILQALLNEKGRSLSREGLAQRSGFESGGGHFNNVLGSLRTLGAIDYPSKGHVSLSKLMQLA